MDKDIFSSIKNKYIVIFTYIVSENNRDNSIFTEIKDIIRGKIVSKEVILDMRKYNYLQKETIIERFMLEVILENFDIYEIYADENKVSFMLKIEPFESIEKAHYFVEMIKDALFFVMNRRQIEDMYNILRGKKEDEENNYNIGNIVLSN